MPISTFFFFASFPTKPFPHVPVIIFCFRRTCEPPARCRHVVRRSPEKAAGFSTKPTTISSLINLRRKAHVKSAVTAALTAASMFSLERPVLLDAQSQQHSLKARRVTCRARLPKAAYETFRTTPKHLQMCLELW